jgi:UPF0755 protein
VFLYELTPVNAADTSQTTFEVSQGEGFRMISAGLRSQDLIRSATAFDAYALLGGRALSIKPGLYRLAPSMTSGAILDVIAGASAAEATVTIPEGDNIYQVDAILSDALVVKPGALIALQASGTDGNLEGTLFPDTYDFYTDANASDIVKEMQATFAAKAQPLFDAAHVSSSTEEKDLILASILEKEVPDQNDQEIVAGILLKRISAGIPLDVDSTVAYAGLLAGKAASSSLDFGIKSPYNTYLYEGLPPGPIGNPGVSAITAALNPQSSPYWYYLSDPKTGETIFAKTLDEQTANRVKYLESE